jgi:hypothetical protein
VAFRLPYKEPFDKACMNAVFEQGYQVGLAGYEWHAIPSGCQE